MERNAVHVSDFFSLPNDQVVEIGRQVRDLTRRRIQRSDLRAVQVAAEAVIPESHR